ncbi:hypothetical protein C1N72_22180 [Pantoea ananatis]
MKIIQLSHLARMAFFFLFINGDKMAVDFLDILIVPLLFTQSSPHTAAQQNGKSLEMYKVTVLSERIRLTSL